MFVLFSSIVFLPLTLTVILATQLGLFLIAFTTFILTSRAFMLNIAQLNANLCAARRRPLTFLARFGRTHASAADLY
jgi:hypothetical protein